MRVFSTLMPWLNESLFSQLSCPFWIISIPKERYFWVKTFFYDVCGGLTKSSFFVEEELAKVDQKVEQEAKNMNLSTVRLCFQTYVQNDQGHFVNALEPVYSNPIFDSSRYTCCFNSY